MASPAADSYSARSNCSSFDMNPPVTCGCRAHGDAQLHRFAAARRELSGRCLIIPELTHPRDREEMTLTPDVHDAVRDRGRRHERLSHRVLPGQLEHGPGLHDEHVAVLAREIEPAVRRNRRSAEPGTAVGNARP